LITAQTTQQPKKSYVQLSQLEHILLKNAPETIRGGQDKEVYGTQHKTLHALKKFNYIQFNTQDRLNWLIFDLDVVPVQVKNIDDMRAYISFVWELEEPTYILKTDKGYHIAYLLEWGVLTKENPKALIKYEHIRNAIGQIMGMDQNARRSHGIWRNPLKHEHYYSGIEYSLDDLIFEYKDLVNPNHPDYYIRQEQKALNEIVRDKTKSLNEQSKFTVKMLMAKVLRSSTANEKIIVNGFRKSTIFQLVMLSAKKKETVTEQKLLDSAIKYNQYVYEPLNQSELRNIAKSVQKYHAENKIYVVNPTYIKDRGVMDLDYKQPLEHRQKQGAEYTHAKRKERTKIRIQVAIKTLHTARKSVNKTTVAKEAGISTRTVQNHRDVYEEALKSIDNKSTNAQNNSVQNGVICCLKLFLKNSPSPVGSLVPPLIALNRRFKKKIKLMQFEKIKNLDFDTQERMNKPPT